MAASDMTLSLSKKSASLKAARARSRVGKFFIYAILIAGCLVTLVPFLWMVTTSLKDSAEIVHMPPTILPAHPTLENYTTIFTDPTVPLARFYMNSILVSISIVGFVLFTSSLAGFIFAKYKFAGQNFFFTLVLATMMIPFQVTMIPLYLIIVRLHIVDSLWGLIIPGLTSAFGIFLMRQFIDRKSVV